jgi:hypothetical protein
MSGVSCGKALHIFDLQSGQRTEIPASQFGPAAAMAVTEDGVRLFEVRPRTVCVVDLRTGVRTALVHGRYWVTKLMIGRATPPDLDTPCAALLTASGCVIDRATRSLVMCHSQSHQIIRLRGVDV